MSIPSQERSFSASKVAVLWVKRVHYQKRAQCRGSYRWMKGQTIESLPKGSQIGGFPYKRSLQAIKVLKKWYRYVINGLLVKVIKVCSWMCPNRGQKWVQNVCSRGWCARMCVRARTWAHIRVCVLNVCPQDSLWAPHARRIVTLRTTNERTSEPSATLYVRS